MKCPDCYAHAETHRANIMNKLKVQSPQEFGAVRCREEADRFMNLNSLQRLI